MPYMKTESKPTNRIELIGGPRDGHVQRVTGEPALTIRKPGLGRVWVYTLMETADGKLGYVSEGYHGKPINADYEEA